MAKAVASHLPWISSDSEFYADGEGSAYYKEAHEKFAHILAPGPDGSKKGADSCAPAEKIILVLTAFADGEPVKVIGLTDRRLLVEEDGGGSQSIPHKLCKSWSATRGTPSSVWIYYEGFAQEGASTTVLKLWLANPPDDGAGSDSGSKGGKDDKASEDGSRNGDAVGNGNEKGGERAKDNDGGSPDPPDGTGGSGDDDDEDEGGAEAGPFNGTHFKLVEASLSQALMRYTCPY